MEFTSHLNRADSDIYHWFFAVPDEVARNLIGGSDRRVVCTVNRKERYHCAIHADGQGGYRIMLNRQRCRKLGLVRGEAITVELEKDRTEYGLAMSDELREVLGQNTEAHTLFHALTKGRQRTLIYWSDNVKNPDIRIRRAPVMTGHLVSQNGMVDFKGMNVEMKAANKAAKRQ